MRRTAHKPLSWRSGFAIPLGACVTRVRPFAPTLDALGAAAAGRLAATALASVGRAWPFHLVHLARAAADLAPPQTLHPVFWGSYDWHSCVHMHWTLLRLLPHLAPPQQAAITAHFETRLTPANVAGEVAYFEPRAAFERPYGWGWLLRLHQALGASPHPAAARWQATLQPLAELIAARCLAFLPRADYPVRAGTHGNSAFALVLALDWARANDHAALAQAIGARAQSWFGADRRYPADYEPGGDDFLSAGLTEALLMQRVLAPGDFAHWWRAFEPPAPALTRWLTPAAVSDATDPKIVHLHGLNLARAWCWRTLAPWLPPALQPTAQAAVAAHCAASLPAATEGHYVGTHWLASFALLALGADEAALGTGL